MATTTTIDISSIEPIGHREGARLAEEEYRRFTALIGRLEPEAWDRQTDCTGWTARDMADHVVGAMRSAASFRETLRQQREYSGGPRPTAGAKSTT